MDTNSRAHTSECQQIRVPEEVCTLWFGSGVTAHCESAGITIRGEEVFIRFDAEGRIVRIELLGEHKRCQQQVVVLQT